MKYMTSSMQVLFDNVHCHSTVQSLKKELRRVKNNGGRKKFIKEKKDIKYVRGQSHILLGKNHSCH